MSNIMLNGREFNPIILPARTPDDPIGLVDTELESMTGTYLLPAYDAEGNYKPRVFEVCIKKVVCREDVRGYYFDVDEEHTDSSIMREINQYHHDSWVGFEESKAERRAGA